MRSMMRHARHTAWAMAIGAGLCYFLDPGQGAHRRQRVLGVANGLLGRPDDDTAPEARWSSEDGGVPAPDPATPDSPPLLTSPAALGSV